MARRSEQKPFHMSWSVMLRKRSTIAMTVVWTSETSRSATLPTTLPIFFRLCQIHMAAILIALGMALMKSHNDFRTYLTALGISLMTSQVHLAASLAIFGTFLTPCQDFTAATLR